LKKKKKKKKKKADEEAIHMVSRTTGHLRWLVMFAPH
jgi:hypothetical protein